FVAEGGLNSGRLNIANAQYRDDARPVEEGCPCECCASYSRAYLSHLFHAKELLYYRLATVHNLQHYLDLARRARAAIIAGVAHDSSWKTGPMAKRVGVILAGCGHRDGSDVGEATIALLTLDRMGAEVVCAAPDQPQAVVANHLTGDVTPAKPPKRAVLA